MARVGRKSNVRLALAKAMKKRWAMYRAGKGPRPGTKSGLTITATLPKRGIAIKAESNGHFSAAVKAEIIRIEAELIALGKRRDLLEQLK